MNKAEKELGKNSSDYIALEKQYVINSLENKIDGNLEKPKALSVWNFWLL